MKSTQEKSHYSRPMVLDHRPVRFETAQSWNKGHGQLNHDGTGNDGIFYPNEPFPGPNNPGLNGNK